MAPPMKDASEPITASGSRVASLHQTATASGASHSSHVPRFQEMR